MAGPSPFLPLPNSSHSVSSSCSSSSDNLDAEVTKGRTREELGGPHSGHLNEAHDTTPEDNNHNYIARDSSADDWDRAWDQEDDGFEEQRHAFRNAAPTQDSENMSSWSGTPSIKGSTETVRMMLLTLNSIGITFTWGVEMTYCTPYLLSLGLSKGQTSLVWIAGPLSGLIVQPIVGVIADQSKSKYGRRRPLIAICSVLVALGLLVLGFTKEIVAALVPDPPTAKYATIGLAVLSLYATDFAINAVMSCSRSLIVDTLPITKQQAGAAWASRMASIGTVIGYGTGAVDLVKTLGTTLGDTQFKQLTVIAAAGMLVTSFLTCWAVTERVLLVSRPDRHSPAAGPPRRFKVVRQIWSTLLTLPPRVRAICWAVFWSWIGWFPFLFYSSTWVGETYFRYDAPPDARTSGDALGEIGRVGSAALTVYSVVTFLGAWLLPLLVRGPDDGGFTRRPPESIRPLVERLGGRFGRPDLVSVWLASNLVFSAAMFLAPWATSFRLATCLVALCGVPWTIFMWAPPALLGVEVNKMTGGDAGSYRRLSTGSNIEMGPVDGDAESGGTGDASSELSGVYFGILNIYSTLPQFIGTFISTLVFAVLEPGKSPELSEDTPRPPPSAAAADGPNAIAVCLFIGAIAALGSARATRKLKSM